MQTRYLHLKLPKRGRFYFAFGVGLIFVYWLAALDAPLLVLLALGFFFSAMIWFAFRDTPAGMEIQGGEWRFFVGARVWSVPLREINSVFFNPAGRLSLRLRDGRTDELPGSLSPDPDPLGRALASRGIPLES